MKLLSQPEAIIEEIELGVPKTVLETRFNPLGLLGIGPLIVTKEVKTGGQQSISFAGRTRFLTVNIDLEDSVAMFFAHGVDRFPARIDVDLEFEGVTYRLFGVFPIDHVEDAIWSCNVDHFKVLK